MTTRCRPPTPRGATVSVSTPCGTHSATPAPTSSPSLLGTCRAGCQEFSGAADFGVRLVDALAEGETVGEPTYNVLGTCVGLNFGFTGEVGAEGGTYTGTLVAPCEETVRDADTTALANNQISVVPLTGDGTAPQPNGRVGNTVRHLGR